MRYYKAHQRGNISQFVLYFSIIVECLYINNYLVKLWDTIYLLFYVYVCMLVSNLNESKKNKKKIVIQVLRFGGFLDLRCIILDKDLCK